VAQPALRQLHAEGLLEPVPDGHGRLRWRARESVRALLARRTAAGAALAAARKERRRAAARFKRWGQRPSFAGAGARKPDRAGSEAGGRPMPLC